MRSARTLASSLLLSFCSSAPVIYTDSHWLSSSVGEKTVIDARSDLSRQVSGYLEGSILASEYHQEDPSIGLDGVIFVVDDEDDVAEEICSENVLCYRGSLEPFSDLLTFPKVVDFNALSILLEENRIVLVDVRNSSELVNPGKIPGSFNIPLYEIPEAFSLEPEQFLEKYKFQLPAKDAQNVVLTCRSGRRVKIAIRRLEPLGFTQLRSYDGSFRDWVARGGEVV
eukprot:TRINITY_DN2652_c0_g1_i1.p1 TRINITY_DN2652_c0_g1~~TRINITY_DN2652_c0_g1_i1.p1  ORF type:complete len:226 (-),score=61.14 TRINITY_DN2652_c0_g1_i1:37-714(-)